MIGDVSKHYEHLTFSGAETKTISPSASANGIIAEEIVLLAGASRTVDVKIGTTQILKGTISSFPAVIPIAGGRGHGGDAGDDLTFQSSGAAEAFVTYREVALS